jgi:hypothetical protein
MNFFALITLVILLALTVLPATHAAVLRPFHQRSDLEDVKPLYQLDFRVPTEAGMYCP